MTVPARTAGDVILSIRGLRIEALGDDGHTTEILKGVDLEVRGGQVVGLVGESGAGKSMLGLAAMGYARPGCRISGGQVLFKGIDLLNASEATKRALRGESVAYVAQSAADSFNPAHRLVDQCTETATQHGLVSRTEARAQAMALYRRMRLPEQIGLRYPHQLSGGQLQRTMTAMAMSCRPDLIIFDEPTTALDVTTQVEVLLAIRNAVRESHTAAIFISHDLAVVAQMADWIMVMRHGRTVEIADTRTILASPRELYTKTLWAVRTLTKPEAEATERTPLLSVGNVIAGYRGVTVIEDISVDVGRGTTTAVVGESGSGKSTLARVITGLLPPRSGSVVFNGAPLPPSLKDRSLDQRRRIQLISQSADTSLNPRQKIAEILGRPRQLYFKEYGRTLKQQVKNLLSMVELPAACAGRYPAELSGGQKQRVAIARALAAEPELLICDEITSGLDQIVAESILKLLLAHQRERQIAYLFITHDLATVNSIADRVAVMWQGRIVEQGSKSEVMAPPHHDYTRKLLASVPQMDPDWLDRVIADQAERPSGEDRA